MKTAILYASPHHHNTEKLAKAIAAKYPDITLIDTTKAKMIALADYDLIGIASGIYFGKFHKSIFEFASENLPIRKKVFLMYTCGNDNKKYVEDIKKLLEQKSATITGTFSCKGYDTYGPFKLVGGLNKHHPDEKDIQNAVQFYENLLK